MQIVIVGLGEVGTHVTRVLVDEGHRVTMVDSDAARLNRAAERFDARSVLGHGGSPAVLRDAGAATADLFIAVTDHCELNIVACNAARAIGARRTVARVMDPAYFEEPRGVAINMLGVDLVINPMFQIADDIRRLVRSRNAVAVFDFADHQIELIQLSVVMDAPIVARPLKELKLPDGAIIAAIRRNDELVIPHGNDSVLAGDEVLVAGRTANILEVEKLFTRKRTRAVRKAMIVGGDTIGAQLARSLQDDEFDVVLLERERSRCEELARQLERTVVLHGDGTNAALLEEEGVAQSDVFVAVSDEDEVNLSACLLARDLGARRCVALVHRQDYGNVCRRLGIDSTLSPRLTVAEQVLRCVREGQAVAVSEVFDGRALFLEFVVAADSRVAGKPLQDAQIPRGVLVVASYGAAGATVPRGDTVLQPGDQAVVFCTPEQRPAAEKVFRRSALVLAP
jgi:trk system potassium uptake protein TrkA